MLIVSAALGAAALLTFGLTPVAGRLARAGRLLDVPDGVRKRHASSTPRTGGLPIGVGMAAGAALLASRGLLDASLLPLAGGALAIWLVGLYDDVHGLGFKRKFVLQALVAYGMLHAGWWLDISGLPFDLDPHQEALVVIPVAIFWMVGVINAVNLLDGHDGLAAGTSLIAFVCLGVLAAFAGQAGLAAVCFVAAAAVAAFLAFNWHPASIFMGDSGSFLLGFLLAAVSVRLTSGAGSLWTLLVPVIVLGLPLLDTLSTMVRRLVEGESPFAPDADHVHHRMVHAAGSVRLGVAMLYGVALVFGALAVLVALGSPIVKGVAVALAVAQTYALLRQLSYVRFRVVARMLQRRYRNTRRARTAGVVPVRVDHATRLPRTMPPALLRSSGDGDGAGEPVMGDERWAAVRSEAG